MTGQEVNRERSKKQSQMLRALADWQDQHPDIPLHVVDTRIYQSLWGTDKASMPETLRAIGSCSKRTAGGDFEFLVDVTDEIQIIFYTARENVCDRVVVGTRMVPEKVVPEQVIAAHVEEIVEWVCPESILGRNDTSTDTSIDTSTDTPLDVIEDLERLEKEGI